MKSPEYYRPEIDGLRAIAVAMVVLFHADFAFTGGFVGVDVFFVISGFLITGIINRDLEADRFSLIAFWDRRIRRILPPLMTMVLAILLIGWMILLPSDLRDLSRSSIAQSLMGANIYFWRTAGYFDNPSLEKPLLHTWSLAVEEQFYVLLPLLLMVLRALKSKWRIVIICFLMLSSFGLNLYTVSKYPSATYYLLPTRAWEMLVGSMLALSISRMHFSRWASEILSLAGVGGILAAGLCLTETTPFPGVAALLPCLAAAAFIAGNTRCLTISGRVLSIRPLVFIGLISYSLYLWHWPILVYIRYWAIDEFQWPMKIMIVAIMFSIATASWAFIEAPFRLPTWRHAVPWRGVFERAGCAIGFSLLLAASLPVLASPVWLTKEAVHLAMAKNVRHFVEEVTLESAQLGQFTSFGDASQSEIELLVWGDSHAKAILPCLDKLCAEAHLHGVAATHSSTAPLFDFWVPGEWGLQAKSIEFGRAVKSFVEKKKIKHVMLVGLWGAYQYAQQQGNATGDFDQSLKATVLGLKSAGASVSIMLEVPMQRTTDIPKILARQAILGADLDQIGVRVKDHRIRVAKINERIIQCVSNDALILDPESCFVNSHQICMTQFEGSSLYSDSHHLSSAGAMRLTPLFSPIVERLRFSVALRENRSEPAQAGVGP